MQYWQREVLAREIERFSGSRRLMAREIIRWKTAALLLAAALFVICLTIGMKG